MYLTTGIDIRCLIVVLGCIIPMLHRSKRCGDEWGYDV